MVETMKHSSLFPLVLSLTLLLSSAAGLGAGVVYTMETTDTASDKTSTIQFQAQDDRVRMNLQGGAGKNQFIIFDGKNETLLIGDPAEKSYLVLDRETLDGIQEMMSEARRRMDEALAQIPESQRERMKQMMRSRMPGMSMDTSEKPSVDVQPTGQSKEIEGYDTKSYEVRVDGRKQSELWVADWDRLEGSQELRDSLGNMADFFTNFLESMPQASNAADDARATWMRTMESVDGFPVRSIAYDETGKPISETTLKSISSAELSPSDFDVPDDYTRQSLDLP